LAAFKNIAALKIKLHLPAWKGIGKLGGEERLAGGIGDAGNEAAVRIENAISGLGAGEGMLVTGEKGRNAALGDKQQHRRRRPAVADAKDARLVRANRIEHVERFGGGAGRFGGGEGKVFGGGKARELVGDRGVRRKRGLLHGIEDLRGDEKILIGGQERTVARGVEKVGAQGGDGAVENFHLRG
jgi:hypothetical protein